MKNHIYRALVAKKKLVLFTLMCLMALSMNAQKYVDLGLPSGTLWKEENEAGGFYTYDQAMAKFGNNLPTKEQFEELKTSCRWTWQENGYKVEGPSGKTITLPAAGYRHCDGTVNNVGSFGGYWSSTPNGPENSWYLGITLKFVGMFNYKHCYGQFVRLVKNP